MIVSYDSFGTFVTIHPVPTTGAVVVTATIVIVIRFAATLTMETIVVIARFAISGITGRTGRIVRYDRFARFAPTATFHATAAKRFAGIAGKIVIRLIILTTVTLRIVVVTARIANFVTTGSMRIIGKNVTIAIIALSPIIVTTAANLIAVTSRGIVTIHELVAIVTFDTVAELFVTIGTRATIGIFDNGGRATITIASQWRAGELDSKRARWRDGGRQSAIVNCRL